MASPKAYVVQHTMVGVHMAGDVIRFTEQHVKDFTIDPVERLLKLGAIREATSDEAKDAVDYGANSEITPLFPAVPFDPSAPAAAHQEVPQKPAPEDKK